MRVITFVLFCELLHFAISSFGILRLTQAEVNMGLKVLIELGMQVQLKSKPRLVFEAFQHSVTRA